MQFCWAKEHFLSVCTKVEAGMEALQPLNDKPSTEEWTHKLIYAWNP